MPDEIAETVISTVHAYAFETEYVHTGLSGVACAELMPSFPTKGVRSESVKERCKDLAMNVKLTDKQLEIMSKGEHVDEDLGLCVPGSSAPTTEKKVKEEMPSKAVISEELKAFKKACLITCICTATRKHLHHGGLPSYSLKILLVLYNRGFFGTPRQIKL